jgi:protein TonB
LSRDTKKSDVENPRRVSRVIRDNNEQRRESLRPTHDRRFDAETAKRRSECSADSFVPRSGSSGRSETGGRGEKDYLSLVRERIVEAKQYPPEARINNVEGTTVVCFRLERDGNVSSIKVVKSSMSGLLDWEAEATIRRAEPFQPIPSSIKRESWDIRVPISFEMIKHGEKEGRS